MLQLADQLTVPTPDHDCADPVAPAPTQAGTRFECPDCGGLFTEARA